MSFLLLFSKKRKQSIARAKAAGFSQIRPDTRDVRSNSPCPLWSPETGLGIAEERMDVVNDKYVWGVDCSMCLTA
jgi:hypothetical protein